MKIHFDKGIFMDEKNSGKGYFCDRCGEEVYSLKCRIIDLRRPNQDDNWIELCQKCEEEVSQ